MASLTIRVLGFGADAAPAFAAEQKSKGLSWSMADLEIAAIAHGRGFSVATRNVSDFGAAGLRVINPWDEAA